jgi:hypothetical protein
MRIRGGVGEDKELMVSRIAARRDWALSQADCQEEADIGTTTVAKARTWLLGSPAMSEALQQLILDTLNEQSVIEDSRSLILPGKSNPALSPDDQTIILGALNSLLSREVLAPSCHLLNSQPMSLPDDRI